MTPLWAAAVEEGKKGNGKVFIWCFKYIVELTGSHWKEKRKEKTSFVVHFPSSINPNTLSPDTRKQPDRFNVR